MIITPCHGIFVTPRTLQRADAYWPQMYATASRAAIRQCLQFATPATDPFHSTATTHHCYGTPIAEQAVPAPMLPSHYPPSPLSPGSRGSARASCPPPRRRALRWRRCTPRLSAWLPPRPPGIPRPCRRGVVSFGGVFRGDGGAPGGGSSVFQEANLSWSASCLLMLACQSDSRPV